MEEYLTVEQVADRLSVGRNTVYKYIKDGRLGAIRLSYKAWRISSSQLRQFLHPKEEQPLKPNHICKPPVIGSNRYGDKWMCPFCNEVWTLTLDSGKADQSLYWDVV